LGHFSIETSLTKDGKIIFCVKENNSYTIFLTNQLKSLVIARLMILSSRTKYSNKKSPIKAGFFCLLSIQVLLL